MDNKEGILFALKTWLDRSKRVQVITYEGKEYTIGKTRDGFLVTVYSEEDGDDIVVGYIK